MRSGRLWSAFGRKIKFIRFTLAKHTILTVKVTLETVMQATSGRLGSILGRTWASSHHLSNAVVLEVRLGTFQNRPRSRLGAFLGRLKNLLRSSWELLGAPPPLGTASWMPGEGVGGGGTPPRRGRRGFSRTSYLDHSRPKGLVGLCTHEHTPACLHASAPVGTLTNV